MIIIIPKRFVRFFVFASSRDTLPQSGVSKFDFSDNLVSKNSAQIQIKTSRADTAEGQPGRL